MRSPAPALALSLSIIACGGPEMLPIVDAPISLADPVPSALCAAEPAGRTISATGEVSGVWSGHVTMTGEVTIAAGAELEICPGTVLAPTGTETKIIVNGTLVLSGIQSSMIAVEERPWSGIEVHGKLTGGYIHLTGPLTCLDGRAGSSITLIRAQLIGCGQAFSLWNGARFDRVLVVGGNTSAVHGGILSMIDSTYDLRHDNLPPDCIYWSDGGAQLDHVRVTGCHCPIHVEGASLGVKVTNSIFDGASVPIMIAGTHAEFSGNNIPEGHPQILDIGGALTVSVANNYWGGGKPSITSGELVQFSGADEYASMPFGGAGPR